MARSLRALALHGFRMNGRMLADFLEDVRRSLGEHVDWTFPDAPHPARRPPSPYVERRWPGQPSFEWWNADTGDDGVVTYHGADRSLSQLAALLASHGPFDLLVGYSQGATLSALLTSRALADPELGRQAFGTRPWRVVLFNSGPPPRDPRLRAALQEPLDVSSLHLPGGPRDPTQAVHQAALALWAAPGRRVLAHREGHQPPTADHSPQVIERLRAAVLSSSVQPRDDNV